MSISLVTPAGNGVHQLTDFKSRLVITSVTVPGELELGQPSYQVLCFVTPITADVIIPAEAITKLRQKHRGAGERWPCPSLCSLLLSEGGRGEPWPSGPGQQHQLGGQQEPQPLPSHCPSLSGGQADNLCPRAVTTAV